MKKSDSQSEDFRSGYATLVGAPNAGKSTLLNAILKEKIAITTPKPQTTRDAIVGIKHLPNAQIVFVDTPGIHRAKGKLNKVMVQNAIDSLSTVDVVVFVVDAARHSRQGREGEILHRDEGVLKHLHSANKPVILLLNKIDRIKKGEVLPLIATWGELFPFEAIIPVSAKKGDGLNEVFAELRSRLPAGPPLFPDDMVTDRSMRFLTAEIIREKLFFQLDQEMPYAIAVEVEAWTETKQRADIQAVIHVERASQKRIVVGSKGSRVKEVGIAARKELERMLEKKVRLELFVRVETKWSESMRSLERFGYLEREGKKR